MTTTDHTHDPAALSWVESANEEGCDFSIQNLPFGLFRPAASGGAWRIGVAIGDQILDLAQADFIADGDMNALMAAPPAQRLALRHALFDALLAGSPQQASLAACLLPQAEAEMAVPCRIGDYTDFYAGIHHATTVGKLFRPDQPLMPNYKWVPIGYHGRSSSIGISGQAFKRPKGQVKPPDADVPVLKPSARMDIELEMGVFVGQGNALGEPVTMAEAEDHIFGLVLYNDWSARDIQPWEYQPLGPFLAKNFASTVSPWVVTMEALAPFRAPFSHPEGDPQPLPYLSSAANSAQGGLDIELEALILTDKMRAAGAAPERITRTNYKHAYWTAAQMVTHHTVNGCNLRPGDLLGTGTLSGPTLDQACALIELTTGGKNPIQLANGESRTWLEDGDTIVLRGWCQKEGAARIGFGECVGTVLPAAA